MRILDPRFKYTPSGSTNVVSTWKRHGYKPTTEAERIARQRRGFNKGADSTRGSRLASHDGDVQNTAAH